MTDTFTWNHLAESSGTTTFAVRTAKFGAGYAQRVQDGINNKSDSWPLSFAGTDEEMGPLLDFLDGHAGSAAFYWTPPRPNGSQGLYTCASYTVLPYGNGDYLVTATFAQAFAP